MLFSPAENWDQLLEDTRAAEIAAHFKARESATNLLRRAIGFSRRGDEGRILWLCSKLAQAAPRWEDWKPERESRIAISKKRHREGSSCSIFLLRLSKSHAGKALILVVHADLSFAAFRQAAAHNAEEIKPMQLLLNESSEDELYFGISLEGTSIQSPGAPAKIKTPLPFPAPLPKLSPPEVSRHRTNRPPPPPTRRPGVSSLPPPGPVPSIRLPTTRPLLPHGPRKPREE